MSDENTVIPNTIQETTTTTENSETDSPAETAVSVLLAGLADGTFTARFPMAKDLSSHKSEAFNVIQIIYEDENPVKNWFQCSVCKELLFVERGSGTQPLLRHECVKKGIRMFHLDRKQLTEIFAQILRIGFSNGPVNEQKIHPILPKDSTSKQWYVLKRLKYILYFINIFIANLFNQFFHFFMKRERFYGELKAIAEPTGCKNFRVNLVRLDESVGDRKRSAPKELVKAKKPKKNNEGFGNRHESPVQVQSKMN